MSKINYFVGIDVSKLFFDVAILRPDHPVAYEQFANSVSGCKKFLSWLKSLGVSLNECLVCAEYTGMYVNIIAAVLSEQKVPLWLEMSYRIIRSSGLQRGKTDKLDAFRIAQYAERHQDQAVLHQPKEDIIIKISSLLKLRDKLVRMKASLQRTVDEYKLFDKDAAKILSQSQRTTLNAIKKDLKGIDKQILKLTGADDQLKKLFKQITSVSGVGKVTALTLICCTDAFKRFKNPKQLACYCGVVPFEYSSGKSIRKRARVHFMANKRLKQLLHMCALNAVKYDADLSNYYERKVEEGKSKMLVLNNVRNKIIHRICACVRDGREYQNRVAA